MGVLLAEMKLEVKVHPRSRRLEIKYGAVVDAYLTEPAENNRANAQLIAALEKGLGCRVALVRGHRSRRKVVEADISESDYNGLLEKRGNA